MSPMYDLEALKKAADLRELYPGTTARKIFRRYVLDYCPFHHDDAPSLLIYADGYKCAAGCGSGDVFGFFYRLEGKSFAAVARMIKDAPPPLLKDNEKRYKKPDQTLGWKYHLGMSKEHFDYYEKYLGFDVSVVQRWFLGYGKLPGKSVGRFTIPTYQNGILVNVKARRDDRCLKCKCKATLRKTGSKPNIVIWMDCANCGHSAVHPDPDVLNKYISLTDTYPVMFNAEFLWKFYKDNRTDLKLSVFLCEGEYKAISLVEMGFYAVSFGAATNFPEEWAVPFLSAHRVYLVPDNDVAGEQTIKRIMEFLPQTRIIKLPNPPKGDVVDFRMMYQEPTEAFVEVVNQQIGELANNGLYRELLWSNDKNLLKIGT